MPFYNRWQIQARSLFVVLRTVCNFQCYSEFPYKWTITRWQIQARSLFVILRTVFIIYSKIQSLLLLPKSLAFEINYKYCSKYNKERSSLNLSSIVKRHRLLAKGSLANLFCSVFVFTPAISKRYHHTSELANVSLLVRTFFFFNLTLK